MIKPWAMLVGIVVFSTAYADEYTCTPLTTTGFAYNAEQKQWIPGTFKMTFTYSVSKPKNGANAYEIKQSGDPFPVAFCKNDFQSDVLFCEGLGGIFRFNKNNGRYLFTNMWGYYNVDPAHNKFTDATSATPILELGNCKSADDAQQGAPADRP